MGIHDSNSMTLRSYPFLIPRRKASTSAANCREIIWAISVGRRLTHPAVQAVTDANRQTLGQ